MAAVKVVTNLKESQLLLEILLFVSTFNICWAGRNQTVFKKFFWALFAALGSRMAGHNLAMSLSPIHEFPLSVSF
jgi:hypothetical protein